MEQERVPADVVEARAWRARVVELEIEVAALRERHDALATLTDRIVTFLKSTHGENSPDFHSAEEAAKAAITSG